MAASRVQAPVIQGPAIQDPAFPAGSTIRPGGSSTATTTARSGPPTSPPMGSVTSIRSHPVVGRPSHIQRPPGQLGTPNGDTSRNGIAVAAMVCGIVSVVLGWVPVLFAAGAVLAVLAIIFGIVGLRRARTSGRRRGLAITGLVTGAFGVPIAVVGLVFTIVVFRAVDRYENPPARRRRSHRASSRRDEFASKESYATMATARASSPSTSRSMRCRRVGRSSARRRCPRPLRANPLGSSSTTASKPRTSSARSRAVNGPLPFGLEID